LNVRGVLERVYRKINKENVIEVISQKRSGWTPEKKNPKKSELKEEFLELVNFIDPSEIEDFVEMAVMSKNIGLPAYTYRVKSLNFLTNGNDEDNSVNLFNIQNHPFNEKYLVTIEEVYEDELELSLTIRLKEYGEYWRYGERNIDTLSAVYKINITLDKRKMVVTIFSGNHYVQEVVSQFLGFVLKWPIQNYRIREIGNQLNQIGNASFKTAALLDLISNRLNNKGFFSRIKEIKFNTKNKRHTSEGIRNITINGRNLLSSQLACEYITLGSDIISFKVEMTYNDENFSTLFFLKGTDLDILKIVVAGQDNEDFKQEVIDIIQEEYIDMCNHGIADIPETKKLLQQIYDKFIHGDKLINEVIQGSTLKIIESFVENLDKLNLQDENILELIEKIYTENKIILDSVGYDEENSNLLVLKEILGLDYEEVSDIYDDQDEEDSITVEEKQEDY
jgi:hypothetical protein